MMCQTQRKQYDKGNARNSLSLIRRITVLELIGQKPWQNRTQTATSNSAKTEERKKKGSPARS
jgi:hypothetical protein